MTRRKRILAGSGAAVAIVAVFCGVALTAGVASGGTLGRASAARVGTSARTVTATGRCKKVGTGHRWKQGGRTGTLYTIEGDSASSCTVGVAWVYRLTNVAASKGPPGWFCLTPKANVNGFCNKGKAVFQWSYGGK